MPDVFTFGSLFAGIGGFDLGLERAGMTCLWQVEIDRFCQKVLAKHWPAVERFRDVRNCGKHNLKTVDLIAGGFPCQPHSVAGKRKGEADDRNLWPEFLRIVEELRPAWVLAENVPGIISLYLDTVLADLESADYTCWTFDIPACAFNAPHRRRRVFIVAYANGSQNVADAQGQRKATMQQSRFRHSLVESREDVSNANGQGPQGRRVSGTVRDSGKAMAHPDFEQMVGPPVSWQERNPWAAEPSVGRVANGIPNRVDRLRALGNAVVPQVAEWIGRQILARRR